jgi:hypothetical protein
MNPSILGGAAVAVLLWLLVSRRRAAVILRSTDTGAIAALNRAQITQVQELLTAGEQVTDPAEPEPQPLPPLPAPGDRAARQRFLRQLNADFAGADAARRLQALRLARLWGHRATLPLLRRALRDVDPAVVLEAAAAMERFRGRSRAEAHPLRQRTLPRNVARTR